MLKQRILEIVLWSFLASYLTAMVFIFSSEQQQSCNNDETKGHEVENKPFWQKVFPDPISFFNFSLVLVTGGLVVIGITQANAAKTAAAAEKSAEAAVAAQRPWIKIDIEIASDLLNDAHGIRLQFKAIMRNIGHSPATNLQIWTSMSCANIVTQVSDAINKIPPHDPYIGFSVFPDDVVTHNVWGAITTDEIDSALASSNLTGRINICVVASARYNFVGGAGETQKIYRIIGPHILQTVDVRKLLIAKTSLQLQAGLVEDRAS
jgi:hypothetical protein